MRTKILLFALGYLLLYPGQSPGQLHPSADPNYLLSTSKSDEFNSLDPNKWLIWDLIPNNDPSIVYNLGGNGVADPSNVSINNGELWLELEPPAQGATPIYTYQECCGTGAVSTINREYGYGYYEVRAKMPGNFHNGLPNGQKIGAAFWYIFKGDQNGNWNAGVAPNHIHDEIDFFETDSQLYHDGSTYEVGVHEELQVTSNFNTAKVIDQKFTAPTNLFQQYHTYACEWLPDRITFFFDGDPIHFACNDTALINNYDGVVVLSLHSHPYTDRADLPNVPPVDDFNPSMVFPTHSRLKIDYFRYYEFDASTCGQNATLLDQNAYNAFTPGVRENVYIGWQSPIVAPAGSPNIFRATNELIINSNFETAPGSELYLIPSPCN